VSAPSSDPTLVRKRTLARAERLKRRLTVASALGFAAFFALSAQHVLRGAAATKVKAGTATQRDALTGATTTYFDQNDDGFSFATPAADTTQPSFSAPAQPMAQSSVS
jgi:hypothetical protein